MRHRHSPKRLDSHGSANWLRLRRRLADHRPRQNDRNTFDALRSSALHEVHLRHLRNKFLKPDLPSNAIRSEEHTSELQSLMRISYAVFCLKKKKIKHNTNTQHT